MVTSVTLIAFFGDGARCGNTPSCKDSLNIIVSAFALVSAQFLKTAGWMALVLYLLSVPAIYFSVHVHLS